MDRYSTLGGRDTARRRQCRNADKAPEVEPLTSDSVWELDKLPARLAVLGGDPVGCELGQAFARLGAEVTIIERPNAWSRRRIWQGLAGPLIVEGDLDEVPELAGMRDRTSSTTASPASAPP